MKLQQMDLGNVDVPSGVELIDNVTAGYKAYQSLAAAVELGLFDWLDRNGPGTREEITTALKLNGMFTRSFLQSLVDLGFLVCTEDRYTNTEVAAAFLVCQKPCYQGDWLLNFANNTKWINLKDMLTVEQPKQDNFNAGPSRKFINALAQRSLRGELQEVVKRIARWDGFSRARTLLDIGGGHGLYAIALCQLNPQLRAVVFDKPHVIEYTREFVNRYGLEERVEVRGGDAVTEDLGSGFDIVLLSHLLYKFRKNLPSIFQRVHACLNSGGLMVSNHWFCSPGCVVNSGGLQELDKAIHSFGHPLCHQEDFNNLFGSTGFAIVHADDIPSAYGFSKLHLAVKEPSVTAG